MTDRSTFGACDVFLQPWIGGVDESVARQIAAADTSIRKAVVIA